MSRQLIDRSKGKWRGILISLGIPELHLTGRHAACPMCGGKDRFRFDDKNGSGSWICNNCGSGYGVHLVQKARGLSLAEAESAISDVVGSDAPLMESKPKPNPRVSNIAGIWSEAREAEMHGVIGKYLGARGLSLDAGLRAVRFAPRTLYLDQDGNFAGTFPCMLGLIQASDGKACGLHRTYLASDGSKQASVPYPKKVLGEITDGAAVRLAIRESQLGIAEGVETALSARRLFGMPVWAALTAGNMEKWMPPEGVTAVTVFGDNDKNFRGQKAAFALGNRLTMKGFTVAVEIPAKVGTDWNDVLRGAA